VRAPGGRLGRSRYVDRVRDGNRRRNPRDLGRRLGRVCRSGRQRVLERSASEEKAMSIQSINPASGEILESFKETSGQELDRLLMGAHAAFLQWREVPFARRAQRMREAAPILRTRRAEYARTMTLERGQAIVQGEAEVDKCAWVCEYYADHAEAF